MDNKDDDTTAGNTTPAVASRQGAYRPSLTSHAYLPAGTTANLYNLTIFSDMLKIKGKDYGDPTYRLHQIGGKRGVVKGFSKASRKRMIEFIASVRYSGQLVFLTLTYPDMFPLEPLEWERHFDTFRKRFQRACPDWRGLWRIELQTRKSGIMAGKTAPHFHILIFTHYTEKLPDLEDRIEQFQQWALRAWYAIVHSGDVKHATHGAHASLVRSRKHAYMYVSKYLAKTTDEYDAIGRRWGHIGAFNCEPSVETTLSQEEYIQLRRIIKRWMKAHKRKFWRRFGRSSCLMGCTVFGLGDGMDETAFNPDATWIIFLNAAKQHSRLEIS